MSMVMEVRGQLPSTHKIPDHFQQIDHTSPNGIYIPLCGEYQVRLMGKHWYRVSDDKKSSLIPRDRSTIENFLYLYCSYTF
jgi:hypothetical protein